METSFKTHFYKITRSNYFLQTLDQLNLGTYSLEILNENHRNEAIDLLCVSNAKSGGNYGSVIFNITPIDAKSYYTAAVDHALNTGLSFVCLDSDKRLAMVVIQYDIVDKLKIDFKILPMNILKKIELLSERNACNDFICAIEANVKYGLIARGDCIIFDKFGVRSDLQGKRLSILSSVCFELMFVMNWKWVISGASHPSTVHLILHKMPAFFNMKLNNVSDDDNHHICCFVNEFDIYPYLKLKFINDGWFGKNLNREWTLNYCKSLKMGCRIINCDMLRKKYNFNSEQFWTHFSQAIYIQKKNRKNMSPSKL